MRYLKYYISSALYQISEIFSFIFFFEGEEDPATSRKRDISGISSLWKKIIDASASDSSKVNKKPRLSVKHLDDLEKISPENCVANVFNKTSIGKPKSDNIAPDDISPMKEQVDDETPEIEPPNVQSDSALDGRKSAHDGRKSSKQFARKRAQKPSVRLGTQDLFYNIPHKTDPIRG